ncbi:hypothetical protein GBA65_20125 [Rubrobacter marinus]|uniref:Glutamate--cysteine ligase n=1 Tax=Rubrobacter marinus TaxID=2653852 RepID=A0A6G8Q1V7_9ACTN|nr:hypothetical protein GBA65_20125 [Rubrobacter marinus]
METSFGASAPYTVGIEEEFQLLDPGTLGLAPLIQGVLAARGPNDEGLATSELSSSCFEMRSPVYRTVSELAAGLPGLRRRMRALAEGGGARLAAAGAHPFSDPSDGPVAEGSTTGGSRRRWAGWRGRRPSSGCTSTSRSRTRRRRYARSAPSRGGCRSF